MKSSVFGSLGATVAALCCAGVPAVLGALSAAGLGFLVNDLILFPLLALFLALGLWGLWDGVRRHGLRAVLVLGGVGSLLMVAGILLQPLIVYAGAAAMIAASVWNVVVLRQMHRSA
ncbi:MAG: MerC domain-containing protein [Actinomycetota bacterium]|nr:MerC domain-containing protein [Rubrobacteraceae bacterium]MBA3791302.1 MerC domain-containing protein [Rubrobacter sp.]MDQ3430137.1 MerC domain-containing protein [Actinomycetota bacterium]